MRNELPKQPNEVHLGPSGEQPEESPEQLNSTPGGDESGPGKPTAPRTLFPLGRVVATPGALDLMERRGISPSTLLVRHCAGDWGDVDAEDAAANVHALVRGYRILSSYHFGPTKEAIWIITEADRSITTLLLPGDY